MRCWRDESGRGGGWWGAAVWAVSGSRAAVRDIWGLSGREGSGSRWRVASTLNGHHFGISK